MVVLLGLGVPGFVFCKGFFGHGSALLNDLLGPKVRCCFFLDTGYSISKLYDEVAKITSCIEYISHTSPGLPHCLLC